jgi:hypothetical protein
MNDKGEITSWLSTSADGKTLRAMVEFGSIPPDWKPGTVIEVKMLEQVCGVFSPPILV